MNNDFSKIKHAIEETTGMKLDSLVVLGLSNDGHGVQVVDGHGLAIAALLGTLFTQYPKLDKLLPLGKIIAGTAKVTDMSGDMNDDEIIKKLLKEVLGGNEND